ncbi:sine oculis-binding protein homolog [Photinus pyralis]|uniref:sine oculis-binding protein homolog n=1 Tax=Photinus pyralis TaxID=7054 RepID=UPI001267504F|nr:sine oculis-binding protein homolog [Photinus pyralis]
MYICKLQKLVRELDRQLENTVFTDSSHSAVDRDECEWCGKHINDTKALTSSKATFCSELCFSQSRRASFKRNRMCDWCKHLRHTVSYVDFQDGASQLQFCSDKCLNQYKMHIFCRETRAHLELHPHVADSSEMGSGLITPEMWLKNCKSPDCISSTPNSPKGSENIEQTSPLPLINTTHSIKEERSSKRMKSKCHRKRTRSSSHATHMSSRNSPVPEAPQDLRVRQTSTMNNFEPIHFKEEYRSNNFRHKFPHDLQNHFMYGYPGFPENRGHILQPSLLPGPSPPFIKPSPLENLMPPVTVLVPYPIIIPLPLPIPIPIPIINTDTNKIDDSNSISKGATDNQENIVEKVATHPEISNQGTEHESVAAKTEVSEGNIENRKEKNIGVSNKKRRLLIDQKLEASSKKKK